MATPDSIFASRTTTRLLDALRDQSDQPAWEHLDARYRPVIAGFARRLGLTDSEADEVAQQTFFEFIRSYRNGRYDRSKGRLSSWILGIAHHTAMKAIRSRRTPVAHDPAMPIDSPDEFSLRSVWAQERDRAILTKALAHLRDDSGVDDRTLLAFELSALRGVPVTEAAMQTGMSVDQVYVSKSRLTKRLRELVKTMTDAFEDDF